MFVEIVIVILLTPTLTLYKSLLSLSKDPFTVITPLLGRIMKALPGFVSIKKIISIPESEQELFSPYNTRDTVSSREVMRIRQTINFAKLS